MNRGYTIRAESKFHNLRENDEILLTIKLQDGEYYIVRCDDSDNKAPGSLTELYNRITETDLFGISNSPIKTQLLQYIREQKLNEILL